MRYEMTNKERRRLKKIAERVVTPGQCLTSNIVEYYRIIAEAARFVFHEDNDITLDDFLMELFQKAMNKAFPYAVKSRKSREPGQRIAI